MKIGVLFGGPSSEHEVSVTSGQGVVSNLDSTRYEVYPIFLDRDLNWFIPAVPLSIEAKQKFDSASYIKKNSIEGIHGPGKRDFPPLDRVFNALHGQFGESGHVQGVMDYLGIKITGSPLMGSAVAMDKQLSKEVLSHAGIRLPQGVELKKEDLDTFDADSIAYPVFIKETTGGSSLNVGRANDAKSALEIINNLFKDCSSLLIEELIEGREFSCGYIEECDVLSPTEIVVADGRFFDFEAKYKGESQEITPADCPEEWTKSMQELAKVCHEKLALKVYSRTDFLIRNNEIFVLEVNTLPGMTPTSILPQQAKLIGMTYSDLLDKIISLSES